MRYGAKKMRIDDETEFIDQEVLAKVLDCKTVFDNLEDKELRTARTRSNPFETIRGGIFQDQDQGQRDGAGDGILNVVDLGVDLISNIGVNLISNIGVDPILNIGVDLISNVADTEGIAPAAVPTVGSLAAENKSEDLPILAVEAADEAESLWSLWSRAAWKMKVEIVALVAWLVWMVILLREDDTRIWPLHHFF